MPVHKLVPPSDANAPNGRVSLCPGVVWQLIIDRLGYLNGKACNNVTHCTDSRRRIRCKALEWALKSGVQ